MSEKENTAVEIDLVVSEGAQPPEYASEGASGADVRACIEEDIVIAPGEHALIPTGLHMAIPRGYEIQVRPRSGLALKHQVTVLNTPGTIDADYRGELKVILMNFGKRPFVVQKNMRIAQLVLCPVVMAQFVLKEQLLATSRGAGGFGHTGVE